MVRMEKQGMTLMEIIVVLIIVGILAAAAFPSFQGFFDKGYLNDAQNNLLSIYAAQVNHKSTVDSYCYDNSSPSFQECLGTSIMQQGGIAYSCPDPGGTAPTCTAIRGGSSAFTLTLTVGSAINLTPSFSTAGRNPSCAGTCPD